MPKILFPNRSFRKLASVFFAGLAIVAITTAFSQPVPNAEKGKLAQEYVAKLDQELDLGKGLVKGTFLLIRRNGQSETWSVNTFRTEADSLMLFERKGRGVEWKLLFQEQGERAFAFNVLSTKMFRKTEEERFEDVLGTGFSYQDLSGTLYQANYTPVMKGVQTLENEELYRVLLKPILPIYYSKLILFLRKKDEKPVRIDYFDRDGVLFKTLNIKYGEVKVEEYNIKRTAEMANRLEMLDLNSGSIGVFEIREIDRDVKTDASLFKVENLGR